MPDPKLIEAGRPNTSFATAASDAFFERTENRVRAQGSQQALVGGDHSLVKALRDFENLEALAAPYSIITIHDVVPMTWTRNGNVEGGDSVPYRRRGAVPADWLTGLFAPYFRLWAFLKVFSHLHELKSARIIQREAIG